MTKTYIESGLELKFNNFRKLIELSGIPRQDYGNTHLHIGLQQMIKTLRNEAITNYQKNLTLEAAHRCMNPELYHETLTLFSQPTPNQLESLQLGQDHIAPLFHMATFRRNESVYKTALNSLSTFANISSTDSSQWDTSIFENVTMYHEMMQQFDQADEFYAAGVKNKKLPIPWRHQKNSHINARKFAQLVPSNSPKWDEKTPEADIVQLDGSPTLLSRVKLRYACYSLNDSCENNDIVHPKINIPHNIVVQVIVRGKNANEGLEPYHKLWSPVKSEIRDYLWKFGVLSQHISRAANLFWVDHSFFDRLPTKGNQNPTTRPPPRPFHTEGKRVILRQIEAEEAEKLRLRESRAAAVAASSSATSIVGTSN
jgi:hypothetical protein